jgi:dienelactone hydrolase
MKIHARFAWVAMLAAALLGAASADAKVVTRTIAYEQGGAQLKGFLAYDDAKKGKRPGVLVFHEWWGLNDYVRHRAEQLAHLGYVAFAADMYGGDRVTRDPKQAEAWDTEVSKAPGVLAARSKAALDVLRKQPQLDQKHVAAIGFCFGGTTALALAYSGEPLQGVVTFHGGLFPPKPDEAKNIRTPIVILHGADDPFVKPETIDAVKKAFDAANVDWYMVTYANTVHSFSNPDSDSYHIPGVAYNEKAATRSWDEMQRFFKVEFKGK